MRVEPGRPVGYRAEADVPPPRPASLDALRFERQPAVRWYSPVHLAKAGMQVIMASAFGSYLDKRELQSVLEQEPFTDLSGRDEAWIDYVADTGDGFDATYTVASLVGRAELDVDGCHRPLPRGDVLVLGGDQVYPDATAGGYEHRLEGPLTAALPWAPQGRRPALFAVPGNHDWYDGLTSFMRVFGQQKAVGGWQTYQTRSYFAIKLPHDWWLLGIDIEFDAYIDEPQLRFFDGLDIKPGDRVVLCTAEPSWIKRPADPAAYRNLAYFERKILTPKGAELALTVAGDLHHYARYQERGGHGVKLTAGGGGAFLHGTHGIPRETTVRSDPDDPATATTFDLACTYPTRKRSRWWLGLGTLALPLRNLSFVLVPAVLYLLLTAGVLRALRARAQAAAAEPGSDAGAQLVELLGEATFASVFTPILTEPVSLAILVLVLLVLTTFATPPRRLDPRPGTWIARQGKVTWAKRGMGLAHTVLHLLAAVLVARAALALGAQAAPGWTVHTVYVVAFGLGGVVGSLTFALYLTVANVGWGAEGNHAFSAQRHTGYKNFLRLHLHAGGIDVYAVGIDRAGTAWAAAPDADGAEDPWVVPDGDDLAAHLIEQVAVPSTAAEDAVQAREAP